MAETVELHVENLWDRNITLTSVAARHTDDRRDNFDIYLPAWLARHNTVIFGALYLAGIAFVLARWARSPR